MIRLERVTKLYRTIIGVNDLNLELNQGTYGLIGPNGSGKTTFINLLTGNLKPTLGRVSLFGSNPWQMRDVLRQVGLCPASDLLLPQVTPLQWVSYLTELHGFSKTEARKLAISALEQLDIHAYGDQRMNGFSLGMRQRVKLAQAIAHDPQLLILDEPFNGLDPIGRHAVSQFLKQWATRGRSVILASHVLHEVEAVTESFLLMHGGRILASGAASDVQSMLHGYPQRIVIGGKGMRQVATALSGQSWLDGLEFSSNDHTLTVSVQQPSQFYAKLLELAADERIEIHRIESNDGSLSEAFDALLRHHRGEA